MQNLLQIVSAFLYPVCYVPVVHEEYPPHKTVFAQLCTHFTADSSLIHIVTRTTFPSHPWFFLSHFPLTSFRYTLLVILFTTTIPSSCLYYLRSLSFTLSTSSLCDISSFDILISHSVHSPQIISMYKEIHLLLHFASFW